MAISWCGRMALRFSARCNVTALGMGQTGRRFEMKLRRFIVCFYSPSDFFLISIRAASSSLINHSRTWPYRLNQLPTPLA